MNVPRLGRRFLHVEDFAAFESARQTPELSAAETMLSPAPTEPAAAAHSFLHAEACTLDAARGLHARRRPGSTTCGCCERGAYSRVAARGGTPLVRKVDGYVVQQVAADARPGVQLRQRGR